MFFDVQMLRGKIQRQAKRNCQEISKLNRKGKFETAATISLSILTLLFFFSGAANGQEKSSEQMFDLPQPKNISLSEQDITETINCFRTDNASKTVETFKSKMPPAMTDEKFRAEILQKIPSIIKQLKIDDSEIVRNTRQLFAPVLELYGKEKVYDVIIFRHSTPVMFSDSGVVLVISTGMIERVANDDELLGFVAHEVGHEYYAKASVFTKHILGFVTAENSDLALARKYWESLGLIELQCDSFAALTLVHLGYNPLAFIKGLERIERDYPAFTGGFHPSATARRKVVEEIIQPMTVSEKTKISVELRKLKELFAAQKLNPK